MTEFITELPSESLRSISTIYTIIICVVNVQVYLMTTLILINCSGKAVGAYKWYTIWSYTNASLFVICMAAFEVEPLVNHRPTIARGLVEYFQMPYLGLILQETGYAFFEVNVIVIALRFIFRYAQNTNKSNIVYYMSRKKILLAPPFLFIFFMVKGFYVNSASFEAGERFRQNFDCNDTRLKNYVKSHVVVFTKDNQPDFLYFHVVFPITLLIAFYCTLKCYMFKNSQRAIFSERTSKLYSRLIHGLVVEQLAIHFYILIPMIVVLTALPKAQRQLGTFVMVRVLFAYPSVMMLFNILFYRQYRKGLKQMLFNLKTQIIPRATTTEPSLIYVTKSSRKSQPMIFVGHRKMTI